MAQIPETNNDYRPRRGFGRAKRHSLRTDMTPMVDLGFLLITFFVFTAQLHQPVDLKLTMPKEGEQMPVPQSGALTLLLEDEHNIYCYQGDWKEAVTKNAVIRTNLSLNNGLATVIHAQQQLLDRTNRKEGRHALMLLIKAGTNTSYQMVVDAIDQALIHDITKYTLMKIGTEEFDWLQHHR